MLGGGRYVHRPELPRRFARGAHDLLDRPNLSLGLFTTFKSRTQDEIAYETGDDDEKTAADGEHTHDDGNGGSTIHFKSNVHSLI